MLPVNFRMKMLNAVCDVSIPDSFGLICLFQNVNFLQKLFQHSDSLNMGNLTLAGFLISVLVGLTTFAQTAPGKTLSCGIKNAATASLRDIAVQECQKRKESAQCQKLYSEIKESGEDLASRSLRCELDSGSSVREKLAVSAIGCLRGGIYDGLIEPIKSLGQAIGTGAAMVVVGWNAADERRKNCDAHPEQKMKLYEIYNQSVPTLLRVPVPTAAQVAKMSCSDIEVQMYKERSLKEDRARRVELRRGGRFEKFSEEEQNYLDWKIAKIEFAGSGERNLWDIADQALKKYNLSIECYNRDAQWALRCEALFMVATTVGSGGYAAGAKVAAKVSGLKVGHFIAAVGKTVEEAGSLKKISEVQKLELLTKANSLSSADRIAVAEQLTGRTLTSDQAKKLIAIHELPLTDLKGKAEGLKALGYTNEQRNVLMRTGITGEFDEYIQGAVMAQKAEQKAFALAQTLEAREIKIESLLKDPALGSTEKEKLLAELKSVQTKKIENRDTLFSGSSGISGIDEVRFIENRIGAKSREIEIAELTEQRTAPLIEARAKSLKELAETKATDKSYSAAQSTYDLAAKDVESAISAGGLKTTKDKLDAIVILQNAGSEKYKETYNQLIFDVAQAEKKSRRDLSGLEFSAPATSPSVVNSQKDSVWAIAREYQQQSIRIELQRSMNESTAGARWEENKKLEQQFEAMIEKRDNFQQAVEAKLEKQVGAKEAQKVMKSLFPR